MRRELLKSAESRYMHTLTRGLRCLHVPMCAGVLKSVWWERQVARGEEKNSDRGSVKNGIEKATGTSQLPAQEMD